MLRRQFVRPTGSCDDRSPLSPLLYCLVLQHKTGLPISTYFSAVKLRWLMDNVDEVHQAVVSHRAMFGTVDSWLIWVSEAVAGVLLDAALRAAGLLLFTWFISNSV